MINLVFGAYTCAYVPVTNLRIELRASRQLKMAHAAQQWPLLGIRNKFIYQKYQIYWVLLISGIINIGYQKYRVSEIWISGTISDISEIYWVSEISVIRNIGYQKYQISEISGIRNIRYLLISVLSYQSSIIEKMSELPVTNLHIPTYSSFGQRLAVLF